jgi:hypothetical protein
VAASSFLAFTVRFSADVESEAAHEFAEALTQRRHAAEPQPALAGAGA